MSKYKQAVREMLSQNAALFDEFQKVHDAYEADPFTWQAKFNTVGEKVLEVFHEYENRLCSYAEGSGYAKFTGQLAEKFQAEVRAHFPKIDFIGVKAPLPKREFSLKKITFS